LGATGTGKIADEGSDQAVLVDALMLIEALVLGGDEGTADMLGDARKRNPHPALVLLENLGEGLALAVQHDARTWKPVVPKPGVVRQVRRRLVEEVDDCTEIDDRAVDLFVLAKLPVSALQVGQLDATKHLGSLDRLRVVHGGRDQVIDIDVLHLKHLEHVDAARMQDIGDQRRIALPVEFRPHGTWRGHDLALKRPTAAPGARSGSSVLNGYFRDHSA
jgi:hypothetical protein